jgi:RNA polymerase sigma-70 factor (sigma-E family)
MGRNGAHLAELFTAHAPAAVRLAYRMTADRHLAEDLVQEAFLRLAAHFPELRDPAAFRGYLHTTVANLACSHFRRVKLERRYVEQHGPLTAPAPDSHLEIWDAVLRLPARQRAVIALRFYEDLSVAQVAKALGCPEGTVKSVASRALDRLRKELVSTSTMPAASRTSR